MQENLSTSKPSLPNGREPTPAEAAAEAATTPEEAKEIERKAREHHAKKAKVSKKAEHKSSAFKAGESGVLTKEQVKRVVLVTDENDPLWDPKMRLPIPKTIIDDFEQGWWDPSMPLKLYPDGRISQGRTKWRAALKVGLDKLEIPFVVVDDGGDEILAMRRGVRLNEHVQHIDPMTRAESILRALSADVSEKEVAEDHGISVNDLHGYLLITDESKCPPSVQEMLREGTISFAAALELAKRADKMTAGQIKDAAEQMAKAAAGGVKVTAAQVKGAAGAADEKVATKKEIKQFLLDAQSDHFAGKYGEATTWALIVGLEVGLGTRSIAGAKQVLAHIAKGKFPKIDFKQYQDGKAEKADE